MGKDVLYRGSSPINPELGRNTYVDAALKQAGVNVIMNLANSQEEAEAYEGFADTYYSGQKVIYLNLGVDFSAPEFQKGLAEGLDLDTAKSKEGKLISVMIGILEEIGMSIEDLEENTVALGEEIDAISDDLSDVEKAVFDEDDDDDDCYCGDEDDDFFEVDCPNCGDTLMIDESVLEEGVIQCPGCKQKFALDLSDDCCCGDGDEDGCGCGCEEHDHD